LVKRRKKPGSHRICFGTAHSVSSILILLFTIGFAGALLVVPLNASLQNEANPSERGRILATTNLLNMVGVILASPILWVLHDVLGWSAAALLAAIGSVSLVAASYTRHAGWMGHASG